MFDVIERLKAEWTDKYVVIDSPAPELSRFAKTTGTVRTVNMNGRCLVEFDQFNNIAWYDIDPSHLKVVTEPLPKPEKQAKAKAVPAAKSSTSKVDSSQKKSASDILAATKSGGSKPTGKLSAADMLAAARENSSKPAGKPSAADILAAARDSRSKPVGKPSAADLLAAAQKAQTPPTPEPTDPTQEESPPPEETIVSEEAPKQNESPQVEESPAGDLPTTTAEKIAWCRQHDAQ